jgi:multidrug transporter EmrE-like cation transporter
MKFYVEIIQKLPLGVSLMLAAISVIGGDYFAKFWSINQKPLFLALAFLGYFLSGFFYIPTLLKSGLVTTSIIWGLLSTIGFLIIGILIFKEHLTMLQTIAAALGVVSLLLFSFSL